jgi:D-cysteine desulfhydrase
VAEGNLLLDHLFGAVVHWCGGHARGEDIPAIADEVRHAGGRPYVIPFGGSNPVGAMGFVAAMEELAQQARTMEQKIDAVVLPTASAGTQAGAVVGADLHGLSTSVVGIAIDRPDPGHPPYEAGLAALANALAETLGMEPQYEPSRFQVRYGYFGGGYAVVGEREREAISLVARTEGILLDPVYTGRAMGALVDLVRRKAFSRTDTVLFWHTGGIPALFEHARDFAPDVRG